jgi:hypothetical protein
MSEPKPPIDMERVKELQRCQALKDTVKRDQCIDDYLKQQREKEQKRVGEQGGMWAGITVGICVVLFLVLYGGITFYKKRKAAKIASSKAA